MSWGWRGRWPGRGPYSYLPPWQRPGWRYGRGACWWFYGPGKAGYFPYTSPLSAQTLPTLKPEDDVALLTDQKNMMEEQLKTMQETLQKIQERLDGLKKQRPQ